MKKSYFILIALFLTAVNPSFSQESNPWYKFSDDGTVCHIYKRDLPTPWFNRLTNNYMTAWVTHRGGLEVFISDPSINALVNPQDVSGNIYIRDQESRRYTWINNPANEDSWECQVGQGYSRIVCKKDELKSETTYFIPLNDNVVLMRLHISNLSSFPRKLKIYSQVEWNLGDRNKYIVYRGDGRAGSQHNLYKKVTWSDNTLWATQPNWLSLGTCRAWPYIGFLSASLPVTSYETIRRDFLGSRLDFASPLEIMAGKLSNTEFWSEDDFPWGVLETEISVQQKGEAEVTFILGMAYDKEVCDQMIKKYSDNKNVEHEFQKLTKYYSDLISNGIISYTPDSVNNIINNIWTKYHWNQVIKRSENDRTIAGVGVWNYGIEGGDISVFPEHVSLPFDRSVIDQEIRYLLESQTEDISKTVIVVHQPAMRYKDIQWDPKSINPENQFNVPHHHDVYGYLHSVLSYLKEYGNKDFLRKEFPYIEGSSGSVWDHIDKALIISLSGLSVNGLPRIPENVGDWMDEFTKLSQYGKAESVMFGMQLCYYLKEYAKIARLDGRNDLAEKWERNYSLMKNAINSTSWDGNWYKRAFSDRGGKLTPIGTNVNKEGKIYLNAQSWAVLSGVADEERANKSMNSVKAMLVSDYGPMIFYPSYTSLDEHIGTLSIYAPGFRNGNIYPRPAGWAIVAACMAGKYDLAWGMYNKTSLANQIKRIEVYQCEPYVYPENYIGPAHRLAGKGQFQWCLGEATSWMWIAYNYFLLGIRPEFDGLVIDPHMPADWDHFSVERPFRGDHYSINVKKNRKLLSGEIKVWVDGKLLKGNLIEPLQDGKKHVVEVAVGL